MLFSDLHVGLYTTSSHQPRFHETNGGKVLQALHMLFIQLIILRSSNLIFLGILWYNFYSKDRHISTFKYVHFQGREGGSKNTYTFSTLVKMLIIMADPNFYCHQRLFFSILWQNFYVKIHLQKSTAAIISNKVQWDARVFLHGHLHILSRFNYVRFQGEGGGSQTTYIFVRL